MLERHVWLHERHRSATEAGTALAALGAGWMGPSRIQRIAGLTIQSTEPARRSKATVAPAFWRPVCWGPQQVSPKGRQTSPMGVFALDSIMPAPKPAPVGRLCPCPSLASVLGAARPAATASKQHALSHGATSSAVSGRPNLAAAAVTGGAASSTSLRAAPAPRQRRLAVAAAAGSLSSDGETLTRADFRCAF